MKLLKIGILSASIFCVAAYAADTQTTVTTTTNAATTGTAMQTQPLDVKNKQAGDAFLTVNKAKPGVVTLPDGLQYKVIKQGTGDSPSDMDVVTVNYEGKTIDNQVFDSSYKRGEPTTFPVSGVIAGWTEALKLMKVGS